MPEESIVERILREIREQYKISDIADLLDPLEKYRRDPAYSSVFSSRSDPFRAIRERDAMLQLEQAAINQRIGYDSTIGSTLQNSIDGIIRRTSEIDQGLTGYRQHEELVARALEAVSNPYERYKTNRLWISGAISKYPELFGRPGVGNDTISELLARITIPQEAVTDDFLRAFVEKSLPNDRFDKANDVVGTPTSGEDNNRVPQQQPLTTPRVEIIPFPEATLRELQLSPEKMSQLTPDEFQLLIADRLDRMGLEPILTGHVNAKDGGIDIIARPREKLHFGILIGVQCEHHSGDQKTGRPKLGSLLRWKGSDFQIGVMVTNTSFTQDARFEAQQPHNRSFLRLRGFAHLSEWIRENYTAAFEADELPNEIELAPGTILQIPRLRDNKN
ncbi:MAG: restriction endonuclease [Phycisphaeraceae bacterium]|nr:restriction endonuclease [Phycisphaeraceae bacterium]